TLILSRLSDRAGERKRHLAAASFLGAVGLVGSALSTNPYLAYAFLCVAGAGIWGGLGVFWTIVGSFMTGVAAAAGIALINTLAQVGGLVGPWFIGLIRDWTGSFTAALLAMSGFTLAAALIALTLEDKPVRRALPPVGLRGTAPQ
ncbi:MAG: MFS transporter, partial [Bradyrhizobium sp.]|nr:MFS transporter [Bradyrhizobium sp.]